MRRKGSTVQEEGWRDGLWVELKSGHSSLATKEDHERESVQITKAGKKTEEAFCFSCKFSYRMRNYKKAKLLWHVLQVPVLFWRYDIYSGSTTKVFIAIQHGFSQLPYCISQVDS